MKRAALVLLVVPLMTLWLSACEGEPPSAPEQPTEATALFGKTIPVDQQTPCYAAGMDALDAAEVYGDAAKSLAKCDQGAKGPCDAEQQHHADAWVALMAAYDAAEGACGGGPPPTGDSDGDGVTDQSDLCPTGLTGWTSTVLTDNDGDGCKDDSEDADDDNDTIPDIIDDCPLVFGTAAYNGCPATSCTSNLDCGPGYECLNSLCVLDTSGQQCIPGDQESRTCNGTGTQTRTCDSGSSWGSWSVCTTPSYNVLDYLLVSEVLQNPETATGDGEFIEIHNSASFAVNLSGVSITGSGVHIALTGSIPAGAYCVYADVETTYLGTCAVYPTLEINDFGGVRVSLVANSTEGHRFIYEDTGYPASPGISVGLPILDSRAYPCEQAATPGAANSECI